MGELNWRDFDESTFQEAERLDRPVLLLLQASWCRFSRRMESEVLSDPELEPILRDGFVLVRVDKDRRPEVNDRYNMGGWPSLCVLTPGGDLITGGTSFTAAELRDLLQRVGRLWAEQRDMIAERLDELHAVERADASAARHEGELGPAIVEKVQRAILEDFDDVYGGFGQGQKFPHSESIDFTLLRFVQTREEALKAVALLTLRQMADSPLHDPVEGGFFRYSTTRDWRSPHTEKLLETNVGLLRNYLEAYQVFDLAEFRQVAEGIIEYLRGHLRHPEHAAFAGSQDSADDYYALDAARRAEATPPEVDLTLYTNWNAAAASALFKASAVLGDASCREEAEAVLTFLLEECYDPGRGMYHYHDGSGRHILGLLTDQAYTARALLHAAQFTGERRYLDVAEDLLQILVAKQTAAQGGFYDIRAERHAVGGLRRRNQSILENGMIAEVFLRAHHLTARPEYLDTAVRTLQLFAEDYHLYGYFTAGYARAVELYLHPPVHTIVVGSRTDPATLALAGAASALYLPSKLVQVIDPEQDDDLLQRFELPAEPRPVAYVTRRGAHVAREVDPAALDAEMRRIESEDG